MTSYKTAFGSYLKAEDIGQSCPVVTIESCNIEEIGEEKDRKPVLHFVGKDKAMACNLTNAQAIEAIVGTDDMDAWVGHQVQLYVDPNVMYGGKKVKGLRVRAPQRPVPQKVQAPPPKPQPLPDDEFQATDGDVPF